MSLRHERTVSQLPQIHITEASAQFNIDVHTWQFLKETAAFFAEVTVTASAHGEASVCKTRFVTHSLRGLQLALCGFAQSCKHGYTRSFAAKGDAKNGKKKSIDRTEEHHCHI